MIKEINMAVIAVDVQDAASVIRILSLIGRIFYFFIWLDVVTYFILRVNLWLDIKLIIMSLN